MKWLFVFVSLLFCFETQAAVNNFRITNGTSNTFDIRINNDAWGVMAGPNFDPTGVIQVDPTRPFDSCELPTAAAAPFTIEPCHPNRVDGPTVISVVFDETSEFTGARPAIAVVSPLNIDGQPGNPIVIARSTNLYVFGQPVTFDFTWDDICSEQVLGTNVGINADGECVNTGSGVRISANIPIRIGLNDGSTTGQVSSQEVNFRLYNPDPALGFLPLGDTGPCEYSTDPSPRSGVCDILPIPGDESAFLITNLEGSTQSTRFIGNDLSYAFNNGQPLSISYTGIRLYFFENPDPLTYFPFSTANRVVADLDISSTSPVTLNNDEINGLRNGLTYTVLAASIDESGTISQFFLPVDAAPDPGYCSNGFCSQVTPSQVAGVIVDSSCFITTATYGSKSAYQVKAFQNFRETFLRGNFIGDGVIKLYNSYGPYGAVFLNNNSYLKPFVRILLYPLYLFSKLSLKTNIVFSAIVFASLLYGFIFVFRRRFFL